MQSHARVWQPRDDSRKQPGDFPAPHRDERGVAGDNPADEKPWSTDEIARRPKRDETISAPEPSAVKRALTTCVTPVEHGQILGPMASQMAHHHSWIIDNLYIGSLCAVLPPAIFHARC